MIWVDWEFQLGARQTHKSITSRQCLLCAESSLLSSSLSQCLCGQFYLWLSSPTCMCVGLNMAFLHDLMYRYITWCIWTLTDVCLHYLIYLNMTPCVSTLHDVFVHFLMYLKHGAMYRYITWCILTWLDEFKYVLMYQYITWFILTLRDEFKPLCVSTLHDVHVLVHYLMYVYCTLPKVFAYNLVYSYITWYICAQT